jgi:hypothetical protein
LGVVLVVSIVAGRAIAVSLGGAVGGSLHAIVGIFLCVLALLRFSGLRAFAEAFGRYDLIAGRWRGYGFAYPFLQLAIGLLLFAFVAPVQVYFASALLFTFSVAGALSAIEARRAGSGGGASLKAPSAGMMLVESAVLLVTVLVMLWM